MPESKCRDLLLNRCITWGRKMPNKYENKWHELLAEFPGVPVDFLASVSEEAINEYLANHFINDKGLYRVVVEQPFELDELSGSLVATVEAQAQLIVDFKPFNGKHNLSIRNPYIGKLYDRKENWHHLTKKKSRFGAVPRIQPPRISRYESEEEADVRITCEDLHVSLEWPKLSVPGEKWTWEADFMILAEANIGLVDIEGASYLELQPVRIKLSLPSGAKTNLPTQFGKVSRKELIQIPLPLDPKARPAWAVTNEDEKFAELVVIVANILTAQYAPTLVQNVKIPVLEISDKQVYPVFLDVSDSMVSVGVSLDRAQLAEVVTYEYENMTAQFMSFLEQDINNAGGIEGLLYSGTQKRSLRSAKQIREGFSLSNRFIEELKVRANHVKTAKKGGVGQAQRGVVNANVAEGMGAAINGYFIQSLLEVVMPSPVSDCAGSSIAKLLKGEVCYGISVSDPVVAISDTSLTGGVNINLGGSVKACIGDGCGHWACTSLALSLDGDPKVTLILSTGEEGVVLQAQFDFSSLHLHTSLPTPFDEVISALGYIVIQALTGIINIILGLIKVMIIPPEIEIPDQNTRLVLKDFTPFPFVREDETLAAQRNTFIGYTVTVDAKGGDA